MKRTNLVLDETLLADAVRLTGAKTYSGAVNFALRELIRLKHAAAIFELAGTGAWRGDLSEMRGDHPRRPVRARKRP